MERNLCVTFLTIILSTCPLFQNDGRIFDYSYYSSVKICGALKVSFRFSLHSLCRFGPQTINQIQMKWNLFAKSFSLLPQSSRKLSGIYFWVLFFVCVLFSYFVFGWSISVFIRRFFTAQPCLFPLKLTKWFFDLVHCSPKNKNWNFLVKKLWIGVNCV